MGTAQACLLDVVIPPKFGPPDDAEELEIPPGYEVVDPSDNAEDLVIPPGYKFVPSDDELVENYLQNKVVPRRSPVPEKQPIQDVDARILFTDPPNCQEICQCFGREWYFFYPRRKEVSQGKRKRSVEQIVAGEGMGFWRSNGEEEEVHNSKGDVVAFKAHFNYFSGSPKNGKMTPWRLEEYRLRFKCHKEFEEEEWALGRLKKGRDYWK